MKFYKIDEAELSDLLEARHRLAALEQGGVDNWGWYGESINDYLDNANTTTFSSLVEEDIGTYSELK